MRAFFKSLLKLKSCKNDFVRRLCFLQQSGSCNRNYVVVIVENCNVLEAEAD